MREARIGAREAVIMADQVRKVDYFYIEVPDKPGEGVRVLGALKEAGINLLNFTAFPASGGKAQLDLVTQDGDALARAAKTAGLTLSARKHSEAGVNVRAANGSAGQGGFGMIVWVAPSDFAAASRALGV